MKYTKAVSATLAGALAVGMVPAMALADDSVELQTLTGEQAFSQGKITAATDQDGKALDLSKAITLTLDGTNDFYVKPLEVTPKLDSAVKVDGTYYVASYYAATGGSTTIPGTAVSTGDPIADPETIKTAGEYYVVVTAVDPDSTGPLTNTYENGVVALKFTLVAPTLKDAKLYEVKTDLKDSSDRVFTFSGQDFTAAQFGVVDGSGKIVKSDLLETLTFSVDSGSGSYTYTATPKTIGNYTAKVQGKSTSVYGATAYDIPFSIVAYDLAGVSGVSASVEAGNVTAVNPVDLNAQILGLEVIDDAFTLAPKTSADTVSNASEKGTYTYVLKPKAAADISDANNKCYALGVTGQTEVAIDVVGKPLGTAAFSYNGESSEFNSTNVPATIDLGSVNPKLFDADLIQVKDGLKDVPFDVVVTNATTGAAASVADVNTPGTWNVVVKVSGADTDYAYAGSSQAVTITTVAGTVDLDTSAAFKYNGQTTGNFNVEYTGADILSQITTQVMAGKKTLVAGTDYTVKVVNSKNVEVDKIVDADTYTLTLESKTYTFQNTASITVTVDPVTVDAVILDQDTAIAATGNQIYYTGEVINPIAKFVKPGTTTEIAVDAASYKVTINSYVDPKSAPKTVKEIKEAGTYNISIADVTGGNITVNAQPSVEIIVTEDGPYLDVPTSKWFADEVLAAKNLNYMTGYYGSNTFGPYDSALRQDVAIVIGRMAGLTFAAGNEGSTEYDKGYESDFSDVVAGAYYAKAVQWINKSGIMTGYSANDEFGVGDEIKRQDLAVALYRYAQKYQKGFTAPKDVAGALAAYTDGAEVSGYAKAAVAWAIENGIMGKDTTALNPAEDITRAELAAMTVRLQPEKLA